MSLFKYFKVSSSSPLPSPSGPLSAEIPSTAINAANEEVLKALKASEDESGVKRRGSYQKYTAKEKATVGNYVLMHGTSAALRIKRKHVALILFGRCPTVWPRLVTLTARGSCGLKSSGQQVRISP